MTSRVLTRWLRQGLRYGICPLCRAHHKLDREYIWGFFDQWSMQDTVVEQFAAARGFCAEHAQQLCRVEVEAMRTTIGITDLYLAAVERLLVDLADLHVDAGTLTQERCTACAYREQGLADNARYLVDELVQDSEFREQLAAGSGLCIAHFRLAWDAAETAEQRRYLTVVQHTVATRLAGELREHARKQRAEAAGEPAGPEADSWQRAIWMSSGWPAPVRAASVPEGENPYAPPLVTNTGTPAPDSKPPAPDSKPPAPDSKPPAPDSKPPAPDSKPPAPDSKPPAPDSKPPAPDSKPPAPDSKPPPPRRAQGG